MEEKEEKQKLIQKYKEAMSNKACILMKDVGAAHLEGTVFTSMHTLMTVERSHRDRKWEHQADTGPTKEPLLGAH